MTNSKNMLLCEIYKGYCKANNLNKCDTKSLHKFMNTKLCKNLKLMELIRK